MNVTQARSLRKPVLSTLLPRILVAIFLVLATIASIFYVIVLNRADGMALAHREELIAELAKT